MAFPKPKHGGGDYELAPADTHAARCYQVVDLGVQDQPNSKYGPKHQIRFTWELVDCPMKDGRNFSISRSFTYSMSEKANLRKILESWRGTPYTQDEADDWSPESVLNAPCLVQVQHDQNAKGGTYAYVSTVTKPPKGMKIPNLTNQPVIYSPAFHDQAAWDLLSEWTQKKIQARLQDDASTPTESENPAPAGGGSDGFDDQDIPFSPMPNW